MKPQSLKLNEVKLGTSQWCGSSLPWVTWSVFAIESFMCLVLGLDQILTVCLYTESQICLRLVRLKSDQALICKWVNYTWVFHSFVQKKSILCEIQSHKLLKDVGGSRVCEVTYCEELLLVTWLHVSDLGIAFTPACLCRLSQSELSWNV